MSKAVTILPENHQTETNQSWYKEAVFYTLNVKTFRDSNHDGIGDFPGLIQSLDYLRSLGITCIWLLPFYPSPDRDNGYDVMDYYNVDPRLGTLADFQEFVQTAKQKGIRIIIDLVLNHTSIQHPWFQKARADKNSPYRDYYVWSKDPDDFPPECLAFPHVEDSIWEYDEMANAYYLHHFYKEQPDLNIENPAVQAEILKIMDFWMKTGISGFRVDAVHYLVRDAGLGNQNQETLKGFLTCMRELVSSRCPDAILLGEANVPPEKVPDYFCEKERMHMLFNFFLNQYMFVALARKQAEPIIRALQILKDIPSAGQWLNYIRNHDELDLSQVSDREQQKVLNTFAPKPEMQIYDGAIRRRLPPMLDGDRRRIKLSYSLMFSLPGTPLIRYGEEIGMGDDLSLQERDSIRTPMQWSDDVNGGFSHAAEDDLLRPVISGGRYGYENINVAIAQSKENSLMDWMKSLIQLRREYPELHRGKWHAFATDSPSVLGMYYELQGTAIVIFHNLADRECHLNLPEHHFSHPIELFSDRNYKPLDKRLTTLPLSAYGYRWLQVNLLD